MTMLVCESRKGDTDLNQMKSILRTQATTRQENILGSVYQKNPIPVPRSYSRRRYAIPPQSKMSVALVVPLPLVCIAWEPSEIVLLVFS